MFLFTKCGGFILCRISIHFLNLKTFFSSYWSVLTMFSNADCLHMALTVTNWILQNTVLFDQNYWFICNNGCVLYIPKSIRMPCYSYLRLFFCQNICACFWKQLILFILSVHIYPILLFRLLMTYSLYFEVQLVYEML